MKFAFILNLFFSFTAVAAPLKLALNWKPEPQFGGFYEASRQKLFQKAGLDLQILEGGSGTPTIQMLGAGQAEYAVVSADEILLAHDRGNKDVVALFASFQTNPQIIMAHAERNYGTLTDVLADGKATLLWQAGLPYAQYLKKKQPNFQIKTAPYMGGIANFQNDPMIAQQGFLTSEPIAAAHAKVKTKVFLVADSGYNPYTTVLAVKASRLKEKPDEVKKVLAAVRQGWADYVKDPTKTNELMHTLNKSMDPSTFTESAKAQTELIQTAETKKSGLGIMTETRWQTLIDQMTDLKLIKSKIVTGDVFKNL